MKVNGWAIRAIREGSRITLRSLAHQIGVDPAHLSRVERGLKPATPKLLARIAVALGVPVQALILTEEDVA